jgi:hypothetical protein
MLDIVAVLEISGALKLVGLLKVEVVVLKIEVILEVVGALDIVLVVILELVVKPILNQ